MDIIKIKLVSNVQIDIQSLT